MLGTAAEFLDPMRAPSSGLSHRAPLLLRVLPRPGGGEGRGRGWAGLHPGVFLGNSWLFLFFKTGVRGLIFKVRHGARADAGGTDAGSRRPWIQGGGVREGSERQGGIWVTHVLFSRLQKILTPSTV